jgi:hypothetical protein
MMPGHGRRMNDRQSVSAPVGDANIHVQQSLQHIVLAIPLS